MFQLIHLHVARVSYVELAGASGSQLLQAATPGAHDKDAQGAGVASMLLTATDTQIRELRQTQGELSVRLAHNFTYQTSLMWPVYVPQGPASPNLALIWGIGVLFGLSLGAFAAIVRNALRRAHVTTVTFNQTHA